MNLYHVAGGWQLYIPDAWMPVVATVVVVFIAIFVVRVLRGGRHI